MLPGDITGMPLTIQLPQPLPSRLVKQKPDQPIPTTAQMAQIQRPRRPSGCGANAGAT